MTRVAVQSDIFLGWARCAVAEGMTHVPLYVTRAASAQCSDVENIWNRLLQIEHRRQKLVEGKIPPEDIGDYTQTWADAESELHRQAIQYAIILAWGDR